MAAGTDVVRALEKCGFEVVATRGSHCKLRQLAEDETRSDRAIARHPGRRHPCLNRAAGRPHFRAPTRSALITRPPPRSVGSPCHPCTTRL
ncbi:type II toxin-antitoxin system HicA family toxin [Microbispora rosea]|uniref:type II toxin-antitoxin system HicA family toxin n=1 Tax=Microbispora rosea TaxID=58117 RepID=UPI00342054D4